MFATKKNKPSLSAGLKWDPSLNLGSSCTTELLLTLSVAWQCLQIQGNKKTKNFSLSSSSISNPSLNSTSYIAKLFWVFWVLRVVQQCLKQTTTKKKKKPQAFFMCNQTTIVIKIAWQCLQRQIKPKTKNPSSSSNSILDSSLSLGFFYTLKLLLVARVVWWCL